MIFISFHGLLIPQPLVPLPPTSRFLIHTSPFILPNILNSSKSLFPPFTHFSLCFLWLLWLCLRSNVSDFVTLWTVARQAPLSMGFSKQECWSGLPCPPPGDLPDPGIKPASLMSPALEGGFFTTGVTWEASLYLLNHRLNHLSPQVCTSTPVYHRGFPNCYK